jgi:hypothetical protein
MGDYSGLPLILGQPRDRGVGAPEFEGSHSLEILTLQKYARASLLVERPGCNDWRAVSDAGKEGARFLDSLPDVAG